MNQTFKAAAVQAAAVYLDLDATIDKTCRLVDEAAANGAKVIASPNYMKIGYGFAKIIAPNGHVISNTLKHDEEGIVYADIDLKQIIPGKFLIDHAGHYSTPGFLSLNFDKSVHEPVRVIGKSKPSVIGYEAIQNS